MKKFLPIFLIVFTLLLAACAGAGPQPPAQPLPTPTVTPQARETPEPETTEAAEDPLAEIVVTRTPQPTATPDRVAQAVSHLMQATGLARRSFFR